MNLNALRLFRQVAHHGSFSRAAVAASTTQPAISRAVAELEATLRLKLFDRSCRPLALTQAGHCLFHYAETIFGAERDAHLQLEAMRTSPVPALRIAASAVLIDHVLAAPIAAFLAGHGGARVDVIPGNLHNVGWRLGNGDVDVGIVEGMLGEFDHLATTPWRAQELALLVPATHPLAGGTEPVALDAIGGDTLIHRESGSATGGFVQALLDDAGVTMGRYVEARTTAIMVAFASAGIGVTIAPIVTAAQAIATGQLVAVPLKTGPIRRRTLIARIETEQASSSLLEFLRIMEDFATRT